MNLSVYDGKTWVDKYNSASLNAVFEEMPSSLVSGMIDLAFVTKTDKDVPIGYVTTRQTTPTCVLLCHGGTFSNFREKGFSSDSLQTVCAYLKEAGAETILFYTKNKNIPMQRLGLANGFFPSGFITDRDGIYIEYQLNTEDMK